MAGTVRPELQPLLAPRGGPKIAEMSVTPIAVTDPPLLNAGGLHAPYALRTIIELVTDDGVSGVSEIPGEAATNAALDDARDVILGADPFQLNSIRLALEGRFAGRETERRGDNPWDERRLVHVFSAIEVACLDIAGKLTGRPVVDLLGGMVRERVPFAAYLFYKVEGAGGELGFGTDSGATGWAAARQAQATDPDGIVSQARAMCAEFGFVPLKLKGGVFEPSVEVETVFALREAFGPDVPLRIDPNAIWSVETAIECGRRMEGVLEYYEDPTRGQEGMAEVRAALNVPLATNMCTTSFEDIPRSIELGSEDIILSDHHFWGGLRASVELGRLCRTFGRKLSMHSNSHVGISLMAMVHMASAIPNIAYALDTHYPWQSEEVIAGGRVRFEDGAIRVPREPGLGVELDREALARLHGNFVKCGLTRRDDVTEMRKIDPDWEFKPVRW
jgi:glucarate dehydratase